jgi:hypothetical protein
MSVRPKGSDWAGWDGLNTPWEQIALLQARLELVRHRMAVLASWEKECEVLRAARIGRTGMSLAKPLEE